MSVFTRLPEDVSVLIMEFVANESLADLSDAYDVRILRRSVLQCVANYCNTRLSLLLSVDMHHQDLFELLDNYDVTFSRVEALRYTCLAEKLTSSLFPKGIRNARISYEQLWLAMIRRDMHYPGFYEDRLVRYNAILANQDAKRIRSDRRKEYLYGLLRQHGLDTLPQENKVLFQQFVRHKPRLQRDVETAMELYRQNVETYRSPEYYFPGDLRAFMPQFVHCCPWTGTWYFCQSYGHHRFDLCIALCRNEVITSQFKIPSEHIEISTIRDMKCTELGDVVLLFNGFPWLASYSESGRILMELRRYHYGLFYRPKQLCVGKSGMNYINDPKTMRVFRVTPDGVPIQSLRCQQEPILICLDAAENVCVLCADSLVLVYNWSGELIRNLSLGRVLHSPSLKGFFSDSRGVWYVVDEQSTATVAFGPGGGDAVAIINGYSIDGLGCLDNADRMSFFNRPTFVVESFRKVKI